MLKIISAYENRRLDRSFEFYPREGGEEVAMNWQRTCPVFPGVGKIFTSLLFGFDWTVAAGSPQAVEGTLPPTPFVGGKVTTNEPSLEVITVDVYAMGDCI